MTAANNPPTGLEFEMKDTKLYVPFVTLSKKTLHKTFEHEQLKTDLKELSSGTNTDHK